MSYKFIKTRDEDNRYDNTDVVISFDACTLDEMLEVFTEFLFACGYRPKGTLDFVEEDE